MGASKRICELLVQNAAAEITAEGRGPVCSMVRFGNVLGSSGSVVSLFRKQIASGKISNDEARRLEQACLQAVKAYDADDESLDNTVEILRQYEQLHRPQGDMSEFYRDTLRDRPWRKCPCEVCTQLGYHVVLFRGAERNRRRGFHNIWTFYNHHLTQSKTDRPIETTPLTSS